MPDAPATNRGFNVLLATLVVVSLPIAGYAISLLFDESVAWSSPEYLIFSLPSSLRTGTSLQWIDLFRGFEVQQWAVVTARSFAVAPSLRA
jgi:hypothetical protein